jgi:hypothetical protein
MQPPVAQEIKAQPCRPVVIARMLGMLVGQHMILRVWHQPEHQARGVANAGNVAT